MRIEPFDEDPKHREIVGHDPAFEVLFTRLREFVEANVSTIELVHIGSTAVPDLRGKAMLDVAAVSTQRSLREAQRELERLGFRRRDVWVDRDDKPYVCGSIVHGATTYNVNIHVCHRDDPVHKDSIAFMEILKQRPDLRRKYERAKEHAHAIDPIDPEVYNRAKEAVIREIHEAGRGIE